MAISDTLALVGVIIYSFMTAIAAGNSGYSQFLEIGCKGSIYLLNVSFSVSTISLAIISIDRYIIITDRRNGQGLSPRQQLKIKLIILTCWLYSLSVGIPIIPFLYVPQDGSFTCDTRNFGPNHNVPLLMEKFIKSPGSTKALTTTSERTTLAIPRRPSTLLTDDSSDAKHFRENACNYNSTFMFTSFRYDQNLTHRMFFIVFKIYGQVYHRISGLQAIPNEEPKYVQVYFIGGAREVNLSCALNNRVKQNIILNLQEMSHSVYTFMESFKSALENMIV
ncbi:C-X-C chemokine receptor type 4 [Trichoplax sp. H2]|nr:C-X-C chemokine receptor type 4 [Trichoplax sp. H2]|eukprot:RDD36133.1 C-X-C chemokine receptor type 4 [Trichoplax sp. H2]